MRYFMLVTLFALISNSSVADQLSPEQKEVWAGVEKYWQYRNNRDVEGISGLWHKRFVGWPCGQTRTVDYPTLRSNAPQTINQPNSNNSYTTIESEGVIVDDDFAVTFVAATTTTRDETGREIVSMRKFTHTWLWTDDGWKIIAGMCGPLER